MKISPSLEPWSHLSSVRSGGCVAAPILDDRDHDPTLGVLAVAAGAERLYFFFPAAIDSGVAATGFLIFAASGSPLRGRLARDARSHDRVRRETARTPTHDQRALDGSQSQGSLARVRAAHFASGSGRTWKWTAMLDFPLPPSLCHGLRFDQPVHSPRPFQPAFGSSMRPLIDLA